MTDADLELSVAIATLRRAEGLLRGPYTQAKKDLLLARLADARAALGRCYTAARQQIAVADPIPQRGARGPDAEDDEVIVAFRAAKTATPARNPGA